MPVKIIYFSHIFPLIYDTESPFSYGLFSVFLILDIFTG